MKICVLSDLHIDADAKYWLFEISELLFKSKDDFDVIVIAGDVSNNIKTSLEFCERIVGFFQKPVIFVLGNHEYYNSSIESVNAYVQYFRKNCSTPNLCVLHGECNRCIIGDVCFIGNTLWSDFDLYSNPKLSMNCAQGFMNDFRCVGYKNSILTPEDTKKFFDSTIESFYEALLKVSDDHKIVFVTHHSPSEDSVHQRFAGDLLTPAFSSKVLENGGFSEVDLWIHGHTHDSFDYVKNNTRVVCNPKGYTNYSRQQNENPNFGVKIVDIS